MSTGASMVSCCNLSRRRKSTTRRDSEWTARLSTPRAWRRLSFRKHGHRGEETTSPSSHGPWNRTRFNQR
uniref:Uncharacterized protein n=1 Tax=Arundo donax TaxID=35708 RepID=A0A0A9DLJ2_ARUDO